MCARTLGVARFQELLRLRHEPQGVSVGRIDLKDGVKLGLRGGVVALIKQRLPDGEMLGDGLAGVG